MTPKARRRPNGAGSVRQFPSGRWQVRVRDAAGVLRPTGTMFDTRLDAQTWLEQYTDGMVPAERPAPPTLRVYAETWLTGRSDALKPGTVALYRSLLDGHILPALGDKRLDHITVTRVYDWYDGLDASTPTQRRHIYGLLRTIMISAWRRDLIPTQPCRVPSGGSGKSVHQATPATVAELDAMTTALPARYKAMIPLASWCALRYGEVTELRRSDIDLDAAVVHVRRGVTRVGSEYVVGTPKSKAGRRNVAIPPHVLPAIEAHLAEHVGPDPGALLFPAAGDPDKHLAPGTWCKVWHPARLAAGRPDLHFHDLRHTGLTFAAIAGGTPAAVMARAGHDTRSMYDHYQHTVDGQDQALAALMSDMATGKVIPLKRRKARAAR